MSDKEILEKAIKESLSGGWLKGKRIGSIIVHSNESLTSKGSLTVSIGLVGYSVEEIIFNHDFAKALWGEQQISEEFTDKDIIHYDYLDKFYRWYDEFGDQNTDEVTLDKFKPGYCGLNEKEVDQVLAGEELEEPIEESTRNWRRIGKVTVKNGWKTHLQQMVLADNPIQYLGEHI